MGNVNDPVMVQRTAGHLQQWIAPCSPRRERLVGGREVVVLWFGQHVHRDNPG